MMFLVGTLVTMKFTASDGTVFDTRKEYREYEMALRYSFANKFEFLTVFYCVVYC